MKGWPAPLIVAVVMVASCASASSDTELVVSAAASLTDAFGVMAAAFEAANPGAEVTLNVGASSSLREQILEGAEVDVFAAADMRTMHDLVVAGATAAAPVVFASNSMVIAVPTGNPGAVVGLADFADQGRFIGLCNSEVPCGALARRVLAAAGVDASVDTEESDVRALLTKIETGELDAGLVYVTDIAAADVDPIDIGEASTVVTEYPIAVVAGGGNRDLAERFVAFVQSEQGEDILLAHGFALP